MRKDVLNDNFDVVEQALPFVDLPVMKANVAAWLKQANPQSFFLTCDKRTALVDAITSNATLDQASVTQSFNIVFGING